MAQTHKHSHHARGFCLVFARETPEYLCTIDETTKKLVVTRKEDYQPKKFLCFQRGQSVVNEFNNPNDILEGLAEGGVEYILTESPDPKKTYIIVVVTIPISWAEDWADIRKFQLEINPKEAIKYGRQNEAFALAHRTYVPILDSSSRFHDFHDGHEHEYEMLDQALWNGIHIAFESSGVPREVYKQYDDNCVLNNRMFLRILYQILTETSKLGGCGFNVDRYLSLPNHPLIQMFALNCGHQPVAHTLDVLKPSWDLWGTKVTDLREYFGEHVAFYFAFLAYYTKWLVLIIPYAIAVSIYQFYSGTIAPKGSEFLILPFFLWATLMSEWWYIKEESLRFRWGMLTYEHSQAPRPTFRGQTAISPINGDIIEVYEKSVSRFIKITFSMSGIFTCVSAVVAAVYGMWVLKALIAGGDDGSAEENSLSVGVGILNSLQIQIFNYFYIYFANYVNEWEGHRLQEEWYNHLVVKRIFFFVVNSFNSLIYLLYISTELSGNDAKLSAARTQLLTLFFTAIVTQNAIEVLMPALLVKYKERQAQKQAAEQGVDASAAPLMFSSDSSSQSRIYINSGDSTTINESSGTPAKSEHSAHAIQDIQADWGPISSDIAYQLECGASPDVLDNSAEIIIQFGYVLLFAVVFPLMPVFSLLNNFIEFAVDFHNYTHMQRPIPHAASGIGVWKQVIAIFIVAAVFNNIGILTFRSDALEHYGFLTNNERKIYFFFVASLGITVTLYFIRYMLSGLNEEGHECVLRQQLVEKNLLMGPQTMTKLNQRLLKKRLDHESFHKNNPGGHGHGHDDDNDNDGDDHGHGHGHGHGHKKAKTGHNKNESYTGLV